MRITPNGTRFGKDTCSSTKSACQILIPNTHGKTCLTPVNPFMVGARSVLIRKCWLCVHRPPSQYLKHGHDQLLLSGRPVRSTQRTQTGHCPPVASGDSCEGQTAANRIYWVRQAAATGLRNSFTGNLPSNPTCCSSVMIWAKLFKAKAQLRS